MEEGDVARIAVIIGILLASIGSSVSIFFLVSGSDSKKQDNANTAKQLLAIGNKPNVGW